MRKFLIVKVAMSLVPSLFFSQRTSSNSLLKVQFIARINYMCICDFVKNVDFKNYEGFKVMLFTIRIMKLRHGVIITLKLIEFS